MPTSTAPDRFDHQGWHVVLALSPASRCGAPTSVYADIHQAGLHRCRLMLSAPQIDPALLVQRLRAKSIAYIDTCRTELQEHDTQSGFAMLQPPIASVAGLSCLIYASRAPTLAPDDVASILDAARRNNPARGITGALCFLDGVYMQYLEGPGGVVELLYRRIAADARHFMPKVQLRQPLAARAFEGSPMALLDWSDEARHIVQAHGDQPQPDLYAVDDDAAPALFAALTRARCWRPR